MNGHLPIVNRLLEISTVFNNAHADNNKALRDAAAEEHWDIVERLLEIPAVRDNAHADSNSVLIDAIFDGNLTIVNRLLAIPAVLARVHANNNKALECAASRGDLPIVNRLLEIPAVFNNAHADNNCALRNAARSGHLNIIHRLLEIPSVRDHIPADHNGALLTDAVFGGNLDIVNHFLEIPAIFNNAHVDDNRALRHATMLMRQDIIERLLTIPAVAAWHTDPVLPRPPVNELATLAANNENAMRALDEREENGEAFLLAQYQDTFSQQGDSETILSHLKQYLIEQYNRDPVLMENGTIIPIEPLEYIDNLPEAVLEKLYTNPFHSAYRYLSDPNPWIAPDASYTHEDQGRFCFDNTRTAHALCVFMDSGYF